MAAYTIELDVEVAGTVERVCRDEPGYHSGYRDEVEDLWITDLSVPQVVSRRGEPPVWCNKSILRDVDPNNPEVVKLLSNLLDLSLDVARDAFIAEVVD